MNFLATSGNLHTATDSWSPGAVVFLIVIVIAVLLWFRRKK